MTTEQALRRLERLGFTIEDKPIQKAVSYMSECLSGRNSIPDRREKIHDWDVFTALILSTWIRRFTLDNAAANLTAGRWAAVITAAFENETFDRRAYETAYHEILRPNGGRLLDPANFYPVSLLSGCLNKEVEEAFVDWLITQEDGIYYIYGSPITKLPEMFESKQASHYLGAVELLAEYSCAGEKLAYVADWLEANRKTSGKWDMGPAVKDHVYFPLSDDWRSRDSRENDCTERISQLMKKLRKES